VHRLIKIFGLVFVLSALAHSAGVLHFYITEGVPDANRVLLDIWIAEALLLGGGLYLAASCGSHSVKSSRALAIFGSLTIIGFTLPMIPVLFSRAPMVFRVLPVIYLLLSTLVLIRAPKPE
jgi:hypothetical protein